jgi:hypothetical protein
MNTEPPPSTDTVRNVGRPLTILLTSAKWSTTERNPATQHFATRVAAESLARRAFPRLRM